MVVSPIHRRRGVADTLMKTAIAHAHVDGVRVLRLFTTDFQDEDVCEKKSGLESESRTRVMVIGGGSSVFFGRTYLERTPSHVYGIDVG